jgi:hypothetical protein
MKTSRFFNTFLPAIVQLSALKLTRMISLLFYPQQRGFTPRSRGKLVQLGQKALLQVFVMSFTAYFYLKDNVCLIAPQSIFYGWGRISSIEFAALHETNAKRPMKKFIKRKNLKFNSKSQ